MAENTEVALFMYMTAALFRSAATRTHGQTKRDDNVVIAHVKGRGMEPKESRCCLNRVR